MIWFFQYSPKVINISNFHLYIISYHCKNKTETLTMEMNDTEFFALNFEQQLQILHQYGSKLMTRDYSIYKINLYSLFDFFIEAWFFIGHNQIENIELIDSGDIIDLYPINLHLEDIFSKN